MHIIIVVAAALVMFYAAAVVISTASREPLTAMHKLYLDRRQSIWTVVLVIAALVLGLSIENLL